MKNWIKLGLLALVISTFICCVQKEEVQPVVKKQVLTNDEVRIAFEKAFQHKD